MPKLSKQVIDSETQYTFDLPVKVLQFGTGVLLRGLCDYLIDKANKQHIFNGRIVVVKSTAGSADDFAEQDGLYTVCVRGVDSEGSTIDEATAVTAISRVISAQDSWQSILQVARNPHLEVILSNTTEVGIQYVEESIFQSPPQSFPAKLTAFLYERFRTYGGKKDKGLVIVPTELITDNGLKLRECVEKISVYNELGKLFNKWLKYHVKFCNSLVDRIVPGKPDAATFAALQEKIGYEDALLTVAEPYLLWAIEGDERVKKVLSFEQVSENVIVDEDISYYRERKLRILNGSHSAAAPLGYLSGFDITFQCMNDPAMSKYYETIIYDEIVPTLPFEEQMDELKVFAGDILNRYRNPFIQQKLIGITLQQSSKMNARNVATIRRYYRQFNKAPKLFTIGFAAYLLFMRAAKQQNEHYLGQRGEEFYVINDEQAAYFYEQWQGVTPETVPAFVQTVLSNPKLWETDLTKLAGFAETVTEYLTEMMNTGVKTTLEKAIL
ncbi:tagaturonate reductase [Runella slithyformis]|uniref:Tagaturonate reductase n=1 Tax=Runella slithyformis (strain ATCC 29530 / DSM 19594 / LMG 11500 / NCIMB 11436 / LSU 4) TaxID=761193 RepID=A0A7U3ZJR9_RUNSL|nr:tagaturonate reductase [Runella slithyformis]AEI48477.1 Tagaturonate reductase [Runella slithyformis DSM 19594]